MLSSARGAPTIEVIGLMDTSGLCDRTYDQEIKSLLLYQRRASPECRTPMHDLPLRRRSVFRNATSRGRIGRFPPVGIEPTTNGLTVRSSTAEADRTGLEPTTPGCSWVRIPLSPPNESAIGRRTSPFHGGNTLTARDGRVIPARGFESHPLRLTAREGFEPSKRSLP